jgi:hypothetical protein
MRPLVVDDSDRTAVFARYSLDSLGDGFTLTAIFVLWLKLRSDLLLAVSGADLLLGRFALSAVATACCRSGAPDRARAKSGLHPHPRERLSRACGIHAQRTVCGRVPVGPGSSVADGCSCTQLIRDRRNVEGHIRLAAPGHIAQRPAARGGRTCAAD